MEQVPHKLRVWIARELERDFELELRAVLDAAPDSERIELSIGGRGPQALDVLVEGLPSRAQLDRVAAAQPRIPSRALPALVIPYAGLPDKTRTLLNSFPRVAVYNLHHNARPTAEMAIALALAAGKQLLPAHAQLKRGDWRLRYGSSQGCLLSGARATVLGYGAVGRHVGRILSAFEVEVRGVRAHPDPEAGDEFGLADLGSLLRDTDLLFVCLPATPHTRGLLGAEQLGALPRGAVLVNVGRADVCDEDALFDALASRRLFAAGLDVWYRYPENESERASTRPARREFWTLDNVVMSPHRAAHSTGTASLRARALAELLRELARGDCPRAVDLAAGY